MKLLTPAQVATLTSLSMSTLSKWRMRPGMIPFHKLGPRRVVYNEDDVLDWVRKQSRGSTRPS